MDRYDTSKPRYSVVNIRLLREDCTEPFRPFETLNPREADFWASIGAIVDVHVWDRNRRIFVYSHTLLHFS